MQRFLAATLPPAGCHAGCDRRFPQVFPVPLPSSSTAGNEILWLLQEGAPAVAVALSVVSQRARVLKSLAPCKLEDHEQLWLCRVPANLQAQPQHCIEENAMVCVNVRNAVAGYHFGVPPDHDAASATRSAEHGEHRHCTLDRGDGWCLAICILW